MLDALKELSGERKPAGTRHAYLLVKRFGLPIRTRAEVDRFLAWMNKEWLAASTQSTILSTIRSVQPGNKPLRLVQVKVPARSVVEEVLSREEIKSVLDDLRSNEEWFYPCFALTKEPFIEDAVSRYVYDFKRRRYRV